MWSDEINKKIQEAETNNDPPYREEAWEKMELLLDEHLPLKKRRRRFIILLFPVLLGAATVFFILQKRDKNSETISQKSIPLQPASPPVGKPSASETDRIVSSKPLQITPAETVPTENLSPEKSIPDATVPTYKDSKIIKKSRGRQAQIQPLLEKQNPSIGKAERQKNNSDNNKTVTQNIAAPATDKNTKKDESIAAVDSSAITKKAIAENKPTKDSTQTDTAQTAKRSGKNKLPAGKKLSINFSAGPDVSSVGIGKPGKFTLQYGIGISYAVSKKVSIRTGFFAGHKKYDADSTDYHPPYTINKLQKVEANCLVYEIPLTVAYNFSPIKKHNWFIAGGLSSYLMKRETYDYYYKSPWGQPQPYRRVYTNKNSHIFSVINFSGGYQYHLNDRLFFMAEPYVKIPVSGIGFGKVKLNSGGLLFTVGFKPFLKKN